MLTKMYLTNFLSFSERTEFDFTASKYSILIEKNVYNEVLKGALFIGPNASGKSNALEGLAFLINLIKGDGVSFEKYRCIFAKTIFTTAEYEFVFHGRKLVYKIEYNILKNSIAEDLTIEKPVELDASKGVWFKVGVSVKNNTDKKIDNNFFTIKPPSKKCIV